MEGNWFAVVALFSWPVAAFLLLKTFNVSQALLWAILGGQLLLPAGSALKLPMVPLLDKASITSLAIFLGCIVGGLLRPANSRKLSLVDVLMLSFVVSPLITAMLNGDVIPKPDGVLPSVGLYDGVSSVISQTIVVIPFILGRNILTTEASTEQILYCLVLAGLFYSLPMLFEIRMSPQLQAWIYGFMPGDFYQEARDGSFRPTVFMGHGLVAAFFTVTCALASCILWRVRAAVRDVNAKILTLYLTSVLLLSKSFGASLYALFLMPLIRLGSTRLLVRIATILAALVLFYPTLRALDLIPIQTIDETIRAIDPDRANSLQTRFDNEGKLLDHAMERPLFGWGRYGRSRLFSDASGRDDSITDGRWIITIGTYGIVGYIAEFGLLAFSVFQASSAARFAANERDASLLAGLSLIVAVNLVELLPNSAILPWTWLLAGALVGRAESLRVGARQKSSVTAEQKHSFRARKIGH
jgi:hypothetical protein